MTETWTARQLHDYFRSQPVKRAENRPESMSSGKRVVAGQEDRSVRKRPACLLEHDEQCALIKWWGIWAPTRGVPAHLLMAIPNGGARDKITGAKLKKEGVRAGAPDLVLARAACGYHGLWIEMKRQRGGSTPKAQKKMHQSLTDAGYLVQVCKGWDEARKLLTAYVEGKVGC